MMPPPADAEAVALARSRFPRGLLQPEGSFRFAMDALLLARFALPPEGSREQSVADLGTGCGVVALALLLDALPGPEETQPPPGSGPTARSRRRAFMHATGVDIDPLLCEAATYNAAALGLADRFAVHTLNLTEVRGILPAEGFDLVVTNPPYRRADQGRHAATERRTRALFETDGSLETFVRAGGFLVRNRGRFCCIYPAERLAALLTACTAARLEPKRMRMVHSKPDRDATLVLLEARKNAQPGCITEPPLILYTGQGEATALTREALEFCPYLACNARGHQQYGDPA